MPKVSIIVPVYKVEKYLSRCIDSILGQTFQDFELILVDDGSPDRCGEICDEYEQKDDRVIAIHKENGGVSSARNTGMDKASGEYIMFVDSDDYIDLNMLEDMLIYDGSDLILSGLKYVDNNGNIIKEFTSNEVEKTGLKEFVREFYINMDEKFLLSGPYNKLFCKEVIKLYSVAYNEDFSICEDGLFVVDFLMRCRNVSCVDKSYYNYVQYGTGTLMCGYNSNAIKACEALHSAKIALLYQCGILEGEQKEKIEQRAYNAFTSFFYHIYTRSGLKNREKYFKAKESLENSLFCELVKNNRKKDPKTLLFKMSVLTKNVLLMHVICSMHFMKFKKHKNS